MLIEVDYLGNSVYRNVFYLYVYEKERDKNCIQKMHEKVMSVFFADLCWRMLTLKAFFQTDKSNAHKHMYHI